MTVFYMLHNEVPLYEDEAIKLDWVVPGSAASNAGLQPGDVIVNFDSQQNPTWGAGLRALRTQPPKPEYEPHRSGRGAARWPAGLDDARSVLRNSDLKPTDFALDKIGFLPVIQPGPVLVSSVPADTPAARRELPPATSFSRLMATASTDCPP